MDKFEQQYQAIVDEFNELNGHDYGSGTRTEVWLGYLMGKYGMSREWIFKVDSTDRDKALKQFFDFIKKTKFKKETNQWLQTS